MSTLREWFARMAGRPCPVCSAPLGMHVVFDYSVSAERTLRGVVRFSVDCPDKPAIDRGA